MARKPSSSKAATAKTSKAKAAADETAAEVAKAGADTAPASKPSKEAAAKAKQSAEVTKDPATETSKDAGAAAEDPAVAAPAPAQDTRAESDAGEGVTDASSPESSEQDLDNVIDELNSAIAGDIKDALFEHLKDELCDPAFNVIVVGPRQGRWRAGRKFSLEPTSIPAEQLTFEQFTQIHSDRMLMVQVARKPVAIEA